MDATSLLQIAEWAGGKVATAAEACAAAVSTDSRSIAPGELFLALRGERFDGHHFIDQVAVKGAVAAIVDEAYECANEPLPLIRVKDTLVALQALALAWRKTLDLKVVAITGSNGKTSTKDFTAAVLGAKFQTLKTQGNLNNHFGVPLTLLRLKRSDRAAVIEIGMNHPGEILPLAKLALPDVAIVTNIGMAHIEYMGSREAIALEKGALLEALSNSAHAVLPFEDAFFTELSRRTSATILAAGIDAGDLRATNLQSSAEGTQFDVTYKGETAPAFLPVPGVHMVRNALLAIGAGVVLGIPLAETTAALRSIQLTGGRLQRREIAGATFIDDTYNANPDSVAAALATIAAFPASRRIAVLGKMGELGAEFERGHRSVGAAAAAERIDVVISVGAEAVLISDAARQGGVKESFSMGSTEEAAAFLRSILRQGDLVLVKGSRSAKMERVIELLATQEVDAA